MIGIKVKGRGNIVNGYRVPASCGRMNIQLVLGGYEKCGTIDPLNHAQRLQCEECKRFDEKELNQ